MEKIILLLISFFIFFGFINQTNATINFTVSPTKYEVEALKWTTIKRVATLYNYSKKAYTITTWKSDFTTSWKTWVPKIVHKKDLIFPDQQLSSWIEIETESFIIAPGEKKDINFYINVPENATPGWHYWAVFFKNNSTKSTDSSEIWVNIDYWILIMLNVDWKVIMKWSPEDINITVDKWLWYIKKDECLIYDFTNSNFDWKCISWPFSDNIDLTSAPDEKTLPFNTHFDLLFNNKWNTHIKPTWKIVLIDSNWKKLTGIWQEIVKNKRGAIVWEKIVDYLPINDVWWNVLPYSNRNFNLTWKWFSYKTYDNEWNEVIKYWNPSEYYTKKNIEARWFIMFWERYSQRVKHEKITALIDLSYKDTKWKKVEFNSAKEFYVNYKENYIWYNPYVLIIMFIVTLIATIIYVIIYIRKINCRKCDKKISSKLKACPYCWKKVKSKKDK